MSDAGGAGGRLPLPGYSSRAAACVSRVRRSPGAHAARTFAEPLGL